MNDVKYCRYIGIRARTAPSRIAFTGVWNLSLTLESHWGITLSNDQARKSLLMKTRLSHDHPMFPMKRPITISHRSRLLGSRTVANAVGTVERGAPPPPFWIAHASMNGSPITLSSM